MKILKEILKFALIAWLAFWGVYFLGMIISIGGIAALMSMI